MAVRHAGFIWALPRPSAHTAAVESAPSLIGRITLGMKRAGVRRAGNPHAAYDVAGVGNGVTGRTEAPACGESRRQTATPRPYGYRASFRPYLRGLGGSNPARLPGASQNCASSRRNHRTSKNNALRVFTPHDRWEWSDHTENLSLHRNYPLKMSYRKGPDYPQQPHLGNNPSIHAFFGLLIVLVN